MRQDGICQHCKARIRWARLASGKLCPVNDKPDRRGTVVFKPDEIHADVYGRDALAELPSFVDRWMIHFVTCPKYV